MPNPSLANRVAMARPIPLLAPVTRISLFMLPRHFHHYMLWFGLEDIQSRLGHTLTIGFDPTIEGSHFLIGVNHGNRDCKPILDAKARYMAQVPPGPD
jgi:hypothetical protein